MEATNEEPVPPMPAATPVQVHQPRSEVRAPWQAEGVSDPIQLVGTVRTCGAGVAVAIVLAATACGGGGGASTTNGSEAAEQWAGGVCTAFVDWQASLKHIGSELKGTQPSSSDVMQAGRQLQDATNTLTRSLKRLGTPDTAGGEAAKKNLDVLATELSEGMNKIEETLKTSSSGGAASTLGALSTVSGTLATMGHSLTLALEQMKQLDPKGELEQAFHHADACSPLFD